MTMGERALFVEHPNDKSNRIKVKKRKPPELLGRHRTKSTLRHWAITLKESFLQAFVAGLHDPSRPSANDWETALVKTVDPSIQPSNTSCASRSGMYSITSMKPKCPFCGTPFKGKLPVLNLYPLGREGSFLSRQPSTDGLYESVNVCGTNNLVVPK